MGLQYAIQNANQQASYSSTLVVVVWDKIKKDWVLLNDDHNETNCDPEFLCFGQGIIPLPLTKVAEDAFISLINSKVNHAL